MSLAGSIDPSEFAIPELAHGRSRAADELRKLSKRVQAAYNAVAAAKAKVRKRRDDLADQQVRLADAKAEVDFTHTLVRDPRPSPHPHDQGGRGLSTFAYIALLVVIGYFQFNVDRGSLLVLRLPLGVTEVLALSLVVISILAAHWTGVVWRRSHDMDPGDAESGQETLLGRTTLAGGIALALVVAAVRGIYAGWLSGVLFAVAGFVLFLVMCFAAYLHHNGAVSRRARSLRSHHRRQRVVRDADSQLAKAEAAYQMACRDLKRVAAGAVERVDQILLAARQRALRRKDATPPPPAADPDSLQELRRMAQGELPPELALDEAAVPA